MCVLCNSFPFFFRLGRCVALTCEMGNANRNRRYRLQYSVLLLMSEPCVPGQGYSRMAATIVETESDESCLQGY